jgi:hypothetical protein
MKWHEAAGKPVREFGATDTVIQYRCGEETLLLAQG